MTALIALTVPCRRANLGASTQGGAACLLSYSARSVGASLKRCGAMPVTVLSVSHSAAWRVDAATNRVPGFHVLTAGMRWCVEQSYVVSVPTKTAQSATPEKARGIGRKGGLIHQQVTSLSGLELGTAGAQPMHQNIGSSGNRRTGRSCQQTGLSTTSMEKRMTTGPKTCSLSHVRSTTFYLGTIWFPTRPESERWSKSWLSNVSFAFWRPKQNTLSWGGASW